MLMRVVEAKIVGCSFRKQLLPKQPNVLVSCGISAVRLNIFLFFFLSIALEVRVRCLLFLSV